MSALWAASEARSPQDPSESYAAALYERHYAAVFRHCLKQLRRREDADDAVQTTFVYALLSLRRGVVPQTELAWLYTIASNVCSSNRRAATRRGPLAVAQDVDALHDVIPSPERNVPVNAADFRSALGSMPATQRNALLLREWQGLSYNEIADKLGLTQAATETLLFRARRTLAQKLQDKAGVGVNGFSIASLLRSLLQSGAGKAVAVALSATAIAVIPAAEHKVRQATHQTPPASHRVVGGGAAPATQGSRLRVDRSGSAKAHQAFPAVDGQVEHSDSPQVAPDKTAAVDEPKPTGPASTHPPSAPAPSAKDSPTAPLDAVVATAADALPDVGLPPIPPVDEVVPPLPELPLPLPGVTVPTLTAPLPIG
jgi:RNA polymerase sigma factor (sigma-70 family)